MRKIDSLIRDENTKKNTNLEGFFASRAKSLTIFGHEIFVFNLDVKSKIVLWLSLYTPSSITSQLVHCQSFQQRPYFLRFIPLSIFLFTLCQLGIRGRFIVRGPSNFIMERSTPIITRYKNNCSRRLDENWKKILFLVSPDLLPSKYFFSGILKRERP